MATQVIKSLVDDIDGSEANGTIRFSYMGTEYEIDLSGKNEKRLRKTLAGYIEKARKVKSNGKAGKPEILPKRHSMDNTGVREWARKNGWPDLSNYGRIPAEIITKYHAR